MKLRDGGTAFDVLAILCSLFTKQEERRCALIWDSADRMKIEQFLFKYKNFLAIILNSSAREYTFSTEETQYLNSILNEVELMDKQYLEEVYLLAIMVEDKIDSYSDWQFKGPVYCIEPLNLNCGEVGIAIYPHFLPKWDAGKSERAREKNLNAAFQNYIMIRKEDEEPFEIIMHYWNDQGMLQKVTDGWLMKVVVTPVTDSAHLKIREVETSSGKSMIVEGLCNSEKVEEKVLRIFDEVYEKQYGIIIFPEAIGTERIVTEIKSRMRRHPEYCTFVLLPTLCQDEENTLVVLGPGGIEVLRQNKGTPFILRDGEGVKKKEGLKYTNKIHILITKELGNVAFPICAELVDPVYYSLLTCIARVNTILCPSFSPGIGAFEKTLVKGLASMLLSVWCNTCSAQSVSKSGKISDVVGLIQLPDAKVSQSPLWQIKRTCQEKCTEEMCYFEIDIEYINKKFRIKDVHCQCA